MKIRSRLLIVLLFVVATVALGTTAYPLVRQVVLDRVDPDAYQRALDQNAHVPAGFLVESVPVPSKALLVGLRPGDIITNYNGARVTNYVSYRTAVALGLADKVTSVTLTVYRAGSPQEISAPSGLLGFDGRDWTPLSDTVVKMIRANRTVQARTMMEGVDTSDIPPEELLIVQLLLMDENDPAAEQVVRELMTQPVNFNAVGDKLLDASRYKTAQTFLSRVVADNPRNAAARVDLAVAYARANQFDDADRVIQDVLAHHEDNLTGWDWFWLLKIRGEIYLTRQNYVAAVTDFQEAIELIPEAQDGRLRLWYLFALAKLGDVKEFERGVAFCEKYSIQETPKQAHWIDALRAYVLSRKGDEAEAKATVGKWRNDTNIRKIVVDYWSAVPGGADVVETWERLLK